MDSSTDLRISSLEAALRKLTTGETDLASDERKTSTEKSSGGGLPNFLREAVEVQELTDLAVPWTTFDASNWIPKGAVAALVEMEWAMQSPNSGQKDGFIWFRKSSGALQVLGSRGRAAGNSDNNAASNQAIIPISPKRTFDYTITDTYSVHGFDNEAVIRLIGYFK